MLWRRGFHSVCRIPALMSVEPIDNPDTDPLMACYRSRNRLSHSCIEKGQSRVMIARRRAALHICVRIIGAIIASDIAEKEQHYLPVTGDSCLLTSTNFPDQAGHKHFKAWKSRGVEFFMLNFWSETQCLSIYPLSQTYVHYPMVGIDRLAELLCLGKKLLRRILFS